jgi:hypothetical protein
MNEELMQTLDKAVELLRAEYKELQTERSKAFLKKDQFLYEHIDSLMTSVKSTFWEIESLQVEVAPHIYLD